MTNDSHAPGRRLKFTLVVRDDSDDPSILDIVRVAIEDGLQSPAFGKSPADSMAGSPMPTPQRMAHRDDLATDAREAIERALADIPTPSDPKFDPAQWVRQLSTVWQNLQSGTGEGVRLTLESGNTAPDAS